MTSECFVYITLPGEVNPITCGMYRLETDDTGRKIGKFVYGKKYLENPDHVEIDPIELQLKTNQFFTTKLNGNFGAFRDASPDYWGRKLIHKQMPDRDLSELDYLLSGPDDNVGALGFGLTASPYPSKLNFNKTVNLAELIEIAEKIDEPDSNVLNNQNISQIRQIMKAGTSMGGARPKITIEDEDGLWLAKFPQREDTWNNPIVEHAMMNLAQKCGISTAETKIVKVNDKDVLFVKRFDRMKTDRGYFRSRVISALTLLGADETTDREKWSYLLLADQIRRISERKADLTELFTRICFNALISNTDDHPRNHAVIAENKAWSLSPAYDLTPNPMVAIERRDLSMAFGKWGRYANQSNLLSLSERFLISQEQATYIIATMAEEVKSTWYEVAKTSGVTEIDCMKIRSAFVYEGFFFDLRSLTSPQRPMEP